MLDLSPPYTMEIIYFFPVSFSQNPLPKKWTGLNFIQLRNDREDQPLCRLMFAVFIHSQKSSSAFFHCFSDKHYDIYTFSRFVCYFEYAG